MNTLNLIAEQQSTYKYKILQFPDGQPHIKIDTATIDTLDTACNIYARISNPTDLLLVLLANDVLKQSGLRHCNLYISYLLAARMDRVMTNGEAFSLRVVGQMLTTAGFDSVYIFDAHSDVAAAVIPYARPISNTAFATDVVALHQKTMQAGSQLCLVSPDAGALKKVLKLSEALGGMDVVECLKIRDVKTGQLQGFKVFDESLKGKTCLIVDDICDGGGTFTGIGAILRQKQADGVALAVSHGIFSKGSELAGIDHIYCTNSYKELQSNNNVTVLPVMNYLH